MKRSNTHAILGAVVMLLASFGSARAQTPASIAGTVTDQNKAVVVGASVKAVSVAGGRSLVVETDASGRYRMGGLAEGRYRLTVGARGFSSPETRVVSLRTFEASVHDFTLQPASITDTITVTAGKGSAYAASDTPQTVVVADAFQIEERRPASTLGAVERAPNLIPVGTNPAGTRPRLRGLASNRLLLVIDGERLNNVRSDPLSGISPSVIDVTQLQAAEVLSGAGSSLYGSDALAGVINLVTKTPAATDAGQTFGLRFDGDLRNNGSSRRGAVAVNWGLPWMALRLSGSKFRAGDYDSGGGAVSVADVLRLGRFANELANASGNNVARTYAVWELPTGARVPNGQGHGFNSQADLWLFPSARHGLRYRQLNSQHKNIGFPFLAAPFDPRNQFNSFRRLDKYGVRYEGLELTRWLPRVAAGFYRQKYTFVDDNLVSTIDVGSSWELVGDPASPDGSLPILTGRPSTFTPGNYTAGKNSVTSYGFEAQAVFAAPFGAIVTTGLSYLRDSSKDEFSRIDFASTGAKLLPAGGRASSPDTVYANWGWFNLVEYEPWPWLRLTGGLRVDRWTTVASVTTGFPLSTEAAVLGASFGQLIAEPGSINVEGVRGVLDLVNGRGGSGTRSTVVTANVGVVVRLPGRVNPYFRWGNTYREPGITERYILRNFGDPTFSVLLVPNTELRPERGNSYEAGVKVQRRRVGASFGYFRNDFEDFLRPVFSPALFVPADPSRGVLPISPFFPFHGVLYAQRANTARARIRGYEALVEGSVPLGRAGEVSLFATAGLLKGSDLTPDPAAVDLIARFYNRADTPLPLAGSAADVPLASITPFRGVFGFRYQSLRAKWFGEYEMRYQGRVSRADPLELSAAITTQYGMLASLNSFAVQTVRAGYAHRAEGRRVLFTFGIENLTDNFYFEHFQNAPAPGRSYVFGITTDFSWHIGR